MGANLQITAIVDGALAVVFGADALWAIIGLLIGNLPGGVVMALHSAQGPRLGLPQMISSRAQFGVYGASVPLVLVIVMYLGFTATGTVLSGQAINELLGGRRPVVDRGLRGDRRRHRDRRLPLDPRRGPVRQRPRRASASAYLAFELFRQHDVSAAFAGNQFDVVAVPAGGRAGGGLAAHLRPVRRRLLALPARGDLAAVGLLVRPMPAV